MDRTRATRIAKQAAIGVGVAFVAIQFVPVSRTNPPVESEVPASAEARSVLRRACYDCHSNETVWPLYSKIAPVSWLVVRDVNEGRKEVNFSTWNRLATKEQIKKLDKSWKEVKEGEMPLWFYLPPHPDARLSPADRATLRTWALSMGATESANPN
ncbi:MAG: heme-binding domain-containing protein [Gemmatimonadota bacterium]